MYKFQQLSEEDLAWLAGLFQSEAYFYLDKRQRAKVLDPDYVPPPPVPSVKIEMIEQDVMERVGDCVGQRAVPQNRLTTSW